MNRNIIKKRDQIWQKLPTLEKIRESRAIKLSFNDLQKSPAHLRFAGDIALAHKWSVDACAWYLESSERSNIDWQEWESLQEGYFKTLSHFHVRPFDSKMSFFYKAAALGLATRSSSLSLPSWLSQALATMAQYADRDAFQEFTSFIDDADASTGEDYLKLKEKSDRVTAWQNMRLRGFCFEVLSEAEYDGDLVGLSPDESWETLAAAAQVTGDLKPLRVFTRKHLKSVSSDRILGTVLWSQASSKLLPSHEIKQLANLQSGIHASEVELARASLATYQNLELPVWIKMFLWLQTTVKLAPFLDSETYILNLAALARAFHRFRYYEVRNLCQNEYRRLCLKFSEDTCDDLYTVLDDLIVNQRKSELPTTRLPVSEQMKRNSAIGSITWQVLRLLGQNRVARLLQPMPVVKPLSDKESFELVKVMALKLSELKGPIMKAGQTASYFGLSLSENGQAAFSALQDQAMAVDWATIEKTLEESYKKPWQAVFTSFDRVPIAVGSIGQVHRASLDSGEEVAVKIRLPGIREIIAHDLAIMRGLTVIGKWFFSTQNLKSHLAELESQLLLECDFIREASMQELFREKFANDADILIPRVFKNLCTDDIIVASYEEGLPLERYCGLVKPEDRSRIGDTIMRFVVTSCRDGLFQSDNHPGNFRVKEDGRLICYDFGGVKQWSKQATTLWAEMIRAAHERNFGRFQRAAQNMARRRDTKTAVHRRLYETYVNHSMQLIGEPGQTAFNHHVLHNEIHNFFSPLKSEIWTTEPDPQFIYGFRVYFGLIALLSQIEAKCDWHTAIRRIMYP